MADYTKVNEEVSKCKELLRRNGFECASTADDLIAWFQADTPYPDITLDEVLDIPLLVVHELVEIDEVKKMGLKFTKDVILKNPEAVDRAHCLATLVELRMAMALGDMEHIRRRIRSIESWIDDPLSTEACRVMYSQLYGAAKKLLEYDARRQ